MVDSSSWGIATISQLKTETRASDGRTLGQVNVGAASHMLTKREHGTQREQGTLYRTLAG
jgi:hypothetical protein